MLRKLSNVSFKVIVNYFTLIFFDAIKALRGWGEGGCLNTVRIITE